MTFVDSNVLLDLLTNDPAWADWSIRRLEMAAADGSLCIDPAVYAEVSVRVSRIESLNAWLDALRISLVATPRAALFLAGKAFAGYRAAGGARTGVLPDFFIGAHAAVAGRPLLTRDRGRFATYFPTPELIAPGA